MEEQPEARLRVISATGNQNWRLATDTEKQWEARLRVESDNQSED